MPFSHCRLKPWALALIAALGWISARGAELTPAFAALVRQVQTSDTSTRATFARIALTSMAEAYEQELSRPGVASKRPGKAADAARWRAEIAQIATELRQRAASVETALRIALAQDGPDSVRLIIDGRNVILQGPRIDAPEVLEARIVAQACLYIACREVAAVPALAQSETPPDFARPTENAANPVLAAGDWPLLPQAAATVAGVWFSLPQGGAVFRSHNGLNFQFSDSANFIDRARLCERLASDFEALAQGIKFADQQGWPVMSASLSLGATEGGLTLLSLNPLGDAVRLRIQEVSIMARLLPVAGAWLTARAQGVDSQHYFPNAEQLLGVPSASLPISARGDTTTRVVPITTEPQPTAPRGWQTLPP